MPLGWVAAAAAVGSVVEGAISANTQSDIASQQMGMAGTVFGEQQGFEQQLQALMANPSSVTSLPGYQFQLQQGSDSVAREMAASGFLGSGNEAAALTQYGQGLAGNFYSRQAQLLSQLAGITSPTNANIAAQGASQANQTSFNQWGDLLGSLGYLGIVGGTNTGIGSNPASTGAYSSTFGGM